MDTQLHIFFFLVLHILFCSLLLLVLVRHRHRRHFLNFTFAMNTHCQCWHRFFAQKHTVLVHIVILNIIIVVVVAKRIVPRNAPSSS